MRKSAGVVGLMIIALAVLCIALTGCAIDNGVTNSGTGGGRYLQVAPGPQNVAMGNYPSITEAARVAKAGDTIILINTTFSEKSSGEQFPIRIPDGVHVYAHGTSRFKARPGTTVDMDSLQAVPAFILGNRTVVENIKFTSSSGAMDYEVINADGTVDAMIKDCDILRTRSGVKGINSRGLTIEGCTFYPGTAPSKTPYWSILIENAVDATIRYNTIVAYFTGVNAPGALNLNFTNNIISRSYAGVTVSNPTLSSIKITWNDFDTVGYPVLTSGGIGVALNTVDGNKFLDPVFVNREGDFRLHQTSPIASSLYGPPQIGALRDTVLYRTAITLDLDPNSPQGQVPFTSPNTELLRFTVTAAPTANVELLTGFVMEFEVTNDPAQPSRIIPQILVAETPLGKELAYTQNPSSSTHGGRIQVAVTQTVSIAAGTTKKYSVYIDSTNFKVGDTIQLRLTRFDWSDGAILRINDGKTQKIDGYSLSF